MAMFIFTTAELIWIAEGIDERAALAELVNVIRSKWIGEIAVAREVAVRHASVKRVPQAIRLIRTVPLSDMDVY
jgi:protein gp37